MDDVSLTRRNLLRVTALAAAGLHVPVQPVAHRAWTLFVAAHA
jgi:hypothetical protein